VNWLPRFEHEPSVLAEGGKAQTPTVRSAAPARWRAPLRRDTLGVAAPLA
jgi:hypothetical protein